MSVFLHRGFVDSVSVVLPVDLIRYEKKTFSSFDHVNKWCMVTNLRSVENSFDIDFFFFSASWRRRSFTRTSR